MRSRDAFPVGMSLAPLLLAVAVTTHAQTPKCPGNDEWPSKVRLDYDVAASRGPFSLSGDSILTFERTGKDYTINVNTDAAAFFHARQTSRGTLEAGGLQPLEYVETRTGRDAQTTTFDWNAKLVHFSIAQDSPSPAEPGLQDRVSLLVQLAFHLHAATAAGPFEIPVAGARRVGPYHLVRLGVEAVKVPAGTIEAAHFERAEDKDRLEAWFAQSWCGLPIRLRFTDKNGGVIDHRIRGASID